MVSPSPSPASLSISPLTHLFIAWTEILSVPGPLPGFNSMFSALATVTPVLVYAQNNGVISFTMVASRIAGTFCGIWLIVMGIFGKVRGHQTMYIPLSAACQKPETHKS